LLTASKRIYSKEEVICDRKQNVSKEGVEERCPCSPIVGKVKEEEEEDQNDATFILNNLCFFTLS